MGTRERLSFSIVLMLFSKPIRGIVNKAMGIHLIGVVNMFG
jgi:hypothetical protein